MRFWNAVAEDSTAVAMMRERKDIILLLLLLCIVIPYLHLHVMVHGHGCECEGYGKRFFAFDRPVILDTSSFGRIFRRHVLVSIKHRNP